ncbi:hypothetical protein KCP76_06160 [Salmonella enterica subsp. enterica serovar Weltevreden]|nr:hypothetical protein KCP76_06160 [Salmonella enterica subsp. enterica serovar Weltevreden]
MRFREPGFLRVTFHCGFSAARSVVGFRRTRRRTSSQNTYAFSQERLKRRRQATSNGSRFYVAQYRHVPLTL